MTDHPNWLEPAIIERLTRSDITSKTSCYGSVIDNFSVSPPDGQNKSVKITILNVGADVDQLNANFDRDWLQYLLNELAESKYIICFYSRIIAFLEPLLKTNQRLLLFRPCHFETVNSQSFNMSQTDKCLLLPIDTQVLSSQTLALDPSSELLYSKDIGFSGLDWDGRPLIIDFTNTPYAYTEGLNKLGHHGVVTVQDHARILLPMNVAGNVHFSLSVRSMSDSDIENVELKFGKHNRHIALKSEPQIIDWGFTLSEPTALLEISINNPDDELTLNCNMLLIERIEITSKEAQTNVNQQIKIPLPVAPETIIFCARTSPNCENENLSDLLTAFCMTFHDSSECCLLILTNDVGALSQSLIPQLRKIGPVACRIQVIESRSNVIPHEILELCDYLISPAAWPRAIPDIMRAMQHHKPVLSPTLNGLEEYIDESADFALDYFCQPNSSEQMRLREFSPFIYTPNWAAFSRCLKRSQAAYESKQTYEQMQLTIRQKLKQLNERKHGLSCAAEVNS